MYLKTPAIFNKMWLSLSVGGCHFKSGHVKGIPISVYIFNFLIIVYISKGTGIPTNNVHILMRVCTCRTLSSVPRTFHTWKQNNGYDMFLSSPSSLLSQWSPWGITLTVKLYVSYIIKFTIYLLIFFLNAYSFLDNGHF